MLKSGAFYRIYWLLIIPLISTCYHGPSIIDLLEPVCFESQVLPIIQTSCAMAGCHDGTAEGFLATDYNSIVRSVTPGDPRGSTLYDVITRINGEHMMPLDRPLTIEQRSIIQLWIAQGAENNNCSSGTPSGNDRKRFYW